MRDMLNNDSNIQNQQREQQPSAAQLLSESLHSTRLLALRRQAAARCAAPSIRMSALLDAKRDGDPPLPAPFPVRRTLDTASMEECVELAVSVALEGDRALLLVSNIPLVATLLAAALQRRRVDAKSASAAAGADSADPFYSPLRRVTLTQCRDVFHALCELDAVERSWETQRTGVRFVVLAPLCELLGPFMSTLGLSATGDGTRRLLQLALKRVRARAPGMAFQARHRWIIQRLQATLGFPDEAQVEELLKTNRNMDKLALFFRADGPRKVFFYYQQRLGVDDDADQSAGATDRRRELFITDGLEEPLRGRALYFVKVPRDAGSAAATAAADAVASGLGVAGATGPETFDSGSSATAASTLDPAVANDHLLGYGVLDPSVLLSVETMLSQLFVPLLTSREESEWGKAERESRNEFMHGLQSFVADIQENLKAMTTGLDLRKPDKRFDAGDPRSLSRLSGDDSAVYHFVDLVQDWCKQTEAYLEDHDQGRWESHDAGPNTELEYWKRRLQRLMGITEQLKSKECKLVTGVLSVVAKVQDGGLDKLGIGPLLRQWKQIDTNITEASNEAKDNVKYLATLERFIEPLYSGAPGAVVDALPALMNSVKMIHTIARYYNTTERMTKLFMKITNQMIALCKKSLVGKAPPESIWDKDPEALLVDLEACLKLNEAYQEQYRLTKDKLLTMPKGKQFDFSETQIFGKFDLFCRRVVKLIDMFSTIHQFRSLALHALEGMDTLLASFNAIIRDFQGNKHDLLDFHNNKFDRDYVEFNIQIADLEASLQQFINVSFDSITSIEQSLSLLKQFQSILQRESLRADLDSKFTVIFHNYGLDLTNVQDTYERYRHDPPIARNLPPVAGNILWSRHLLRRIEEPMRKFESNPTVLSTKDSKKIIKMYNKVARTLVAFEYLWYEAWCRSVETAKAGLHATLIIRHPETGKLYVNFDKEILQLIREAKCLDRMGIEVPENAKMVMLQEDKFKLYYHDLTYTLKEYDRVTSKIIPVTATLLAPHLADLQQKLRPGMVTLTWTSMNIDAYKLQAHVGLQRLEELINTVFDIIENRIEKNLKVVSRASLVYLPTDQSFALDDFVRIQEKHVGTVTVLLSAKNVEIENAVEDVLRLLCEYALDAAASPTAPSVITLPASPMGTASSALPNASAIVASTNPDDERGERVACDQAAMAAFRSHYKHLFYRALLNCTKQSLDAIKKRVCSKAGTGFLFLERPFFEVDVQLSVPSVRLSPSLDDIQRAINRSAVAVLKCSKSLYEWGQQHIEPELARVSLFEKLGCDTEIIKVAILLTGALHGTKNQVHEYLAAFKKYDWLWKEDMEFRYNQFMKRGPGIQDFENELRLFMRVEAEITHIAPVHNIAVLSLNTKNLKLQLRNECRQWKVQYSDKVHQQARAALSSLTEYVRVTTVKLATPVDSLDALRFVMGVLKEVRERESAIEMEINPITDMYDMLEHFLPGGYMDKDEMDQKSVVRSAWRKLVDYAEDVTDTLSDVQGVFKKQLLKDVKDFQVDLLQFRCEYLETGPMVSGLEPAEAVARLKRFKDLLLTRERKLEVYSAGEELFGMRPTEYPELVRTKKELALLDQLYGLYMDVVTTTDEFSAIPWRLVGASLQRMGDAFSGFDLRCKKLPKTLCEWEAYHILRRDINDFLDVLPLVRELSRESIKPRHWDELVRTCGQALPVESEGFRFQDIVAARLLTWREEVEAICESAQKQQQIESKIKDIKERWAGTSFEFGEWRARSVPVLKGYGLVIEDLEESQLQLQAMLSMRHVVFFKDSVQAKLAQLSDTADVLELWVKVQTLWMSLESVFTGGDIAKQMPLEAKKFAKIDKDWSKVMGKAGEIGVVVGCCANELLRSTLPILFGELEKCQKSLEGYLEQKRKKFPRFYFVSNPLLLLILSRGSDPAAVQQYYEKIFDSIDEVVHEDKPTGGDKRRILQFKSRVGSDEEVIALVHPVVADGNIEDWLRTLEREMRGTMKAVCRSAAAECSAGSLRDFVAKYCGQFALLGIQLSWTAECQDALHKCRAAKGVMQQTAKKHGAMLSELSSWCLTDLGSAMTRTKVETLITVQVHQRDCFLELCRLVKEKKVVDASDFEWLKQARFYWKPAPASDSVGVDACQRPASKNAAIASAVASVLAKNNRVESPAWTTKVLQFYDTTAVRHGIILVGPAGSGKSEIFRTLQSALSAQTKTPHRQHHREHLRQCIAHLVGTCCSSTGGSGAGPGHLFEYFRKHCRPVIAQPRVALMQSCLNLLHSLLQRCELSEAGADLELELERLFVFALAWALGGVLDLDDRVKLSRYLNDKAPAAFPKSDESDKSATIYDHFLHASTLEWEKWMCEASENLLAVTDNVASLIVPTADTARSLYLIEHLHACRFPVMLVGETGTGKSTLARLFCESRRGADDQTLLFKHVIFSGASQPGGFQAVVEAELEKRGGKTFGPASGKKLTFFLDDLSMPALNEWMDQPTLEVVRQLVETNSLCFLDKDKRGDIKAIEDLRYVAAMGHPKGGKNDIPSRLKRHFVVLNILSPTPELVEAIYGQLVRWRFGDLDSGARRAVLDVAARLAAASSQLWAWMRKAMLPTPQKFHYLFSMRELSRCYQGILRAPLESVTSERVLARLWRHESERVFSDRLVSVEDKYRFRDESALIADAVLLLPKPAAKDKAAEPPVLFVDFLADAVVDEDGELVAEAPKRYESAASVQAVRARTEQLLQQFNRENPGKQLPLVLFDEALLHLVRVSRVLGMAQNHMMLVGVGGSGKQSLARLAAVIAGHHVFQITITKTYALASFLDDLRALFKVAGQAGKGVAFLITDAEIKDEAFLEQINALLATGEVPGLFPRDELTVLASELRGLMLKAHPERPDTSDNLIRFFFDRVRRNLHVLLCLSPVSPRFADRCREFPNLISGCTLDWFLPWPEEALVAVGSESLAGFAIDGPAALKESLVAQMGRIHQVVVDTCGEYFAKRRRHVSQTPRAFLHFLARYKALYREKLGEIARNESAIHIGLQKLVQGAQDVEKMKRVLKDEEAKLVAAEAAATKMLETLQVKSLEAKKENDVVQKIKEQCEADAAGILEEKEAAEEDLKKAQPFLDEAERAVSSIKPNDLNELKKLAKPGDIIKLIFDCVAVLQMTPLLKVERSPVTLGVGKDKKTLDFVLDSFQIVKSGMLADTRFLQHIFHFSKHLKDNINDETVELMAPYLELDGFSAPVAKNASKAAEGLFCWVQAMSMYHDASKVVTPKLEALRIAEGKFEAAQASLQASEEKLVRCQAVLARLQDDFQAQMAEKAKLEEYAHATKKKMEQATTLISGLGGEKRRWTEDSDRFVERKTHLVGDCALAAAFLSYAGPFDREFRGLLLCERVPHELASKHIPLSPDLREAERLPACGVVALASPKLREHLEFCVSEGRALVLDGVDQDVDPVLTNVLDKNVVVRAKSKFVSILDRACEYSDDFRLYMTTRLPNPHFSPELQARTMVVDFTVTQRGLEEQLLARVIQKEQRSLEEQLLRVQTDLNANTKALLALDALLLARLSANAGNLLDDADLIGVLANTKLKATEVNDKIVAAEDMKRGIDEKREHYRPVATRGSVLYFGIVEFAAVNPMYQSSLDQFLVLFTRAIDASERASLVSKRVSHILETLTYVVYRYINRGLYEKDKLSFVLMAALKILATAECIGASDITLFLKAGASRKLSPDQPKPFGWMTNQAWLNAVQLASDKPHFRTLPADLERSEGLWKKWYEDNEPERLPLPDYESVLFDPRGMTANLHFHRLLLVRALREDRTILAVHDFLRALEFVESASSSSLAKLPAMGPRFTEAATDTVESVFHDMLPETPVLYLLSPGADPTEAIELFARKKRQSVQSISMGEGQEGVAARAIGAAMLNGSWVLLQNCHLGLEYMASMEDVLAKAKESAAADFRLFLTSEPHARFPIALLHKCTKVTNEPPAGLRAGMLRSFTVLVDQDKLDRIESAQWRRLLFAFCFLHSVVQERRKFGALGFGVPYEFSASDLSAAISFLERHLYASPLSWATVQYMVADVHYGGRITDEMDRRLFKAYCEAWLTPAVLTTAFSFSPEHVVVKGGSAGQQQPALFNYCIPDAADIDEFQRLIGAFPTVDSPEVFGLHPNADLTYRVKEVTSLLNGILETQPKDHSAGRGGETREDIVLRKCNELASALPESVSAADAALAIRAKLGGVEAPLNIFLFQEAQRLELVLAIVQRTLDETQRAIAGEIAITGAIRGTIDAVFDGKVPRAWVYRSAGDEISWRSSTLGLWFTGLADRTVQLRSWLEKGRPHSFWLAGFANPQGLLTAMTQEVTRHHAAERWALDDVVYHSEVTDYEKLEQIKQAPRDGILVHGLLVDGAAWNRNDGTLVEAEPKRLFAPLPVVYVTATTKAQKKNRTNDYGPYGGYEAPCYKYALRTDRYYIFSVVLSSRDHRPLHWTLRGVALLCSADQ
ncbi:hypothetical protein PybrP1_001566 [[Pythium] brassicae (nom. inval.)]|nr:hypothetical protein PybrP1_001566 [[Pythium] brassicae (nom. inval.)]